MVNERKLARDLRPGAQNQQQPWRPKIRLTTRERKLVARVRKRRTKTHKNIVALVARDLRLAVDDPCVNEEVECACRTWEALVAAAPEPRTPLQRLLAERSTLLVAEREVLQAAARRQIEDNDESFYC
jgi:hypothetical protein